MLIPKVEGRIAQYLHFLEDARYQKTGDLDFEVFETGETFRRPPENLPGSAVSWTRIAAPYGYGKPWICFWFRSVFTAPSGSGRPVFLQAVPNADSLVFIDGKPAGAFNPFHRKLRIERDGKEHSLHIEAYSGHPFPGQHPFDKESVILTLSRQIPAYPNIFEGASLLERIDPVYSLYYDARVLFELAKTLDGNSLRKARILKGLYDALMAVHFSSTGKILEEEAALAGQRIAPLLAEKNSASVPTIHLIGHAHIDHAWLWHIGETERKAARTYINMIRLGEEYPEFVFIQTQSAQLEIVKDRYPEIFSRIQEAFRRGRWEPNGGMWVEADCNISGGESLIRQFLVGKAAVKEMLGYEGDTLWLPDVFGYAAALPQILLGCGIKYFVTSKINWNDTTRFPYDTFLWRGIDGSVIKTHYISSRTEGYNGSVNPEGFREIWNEVQHKEIQGTVIKSIGEGDGGGGTTREDLEMARRLADLEGAPRSGWKKVSHALDDIFSDNADWPQWQGELYLELHRGTYTTQARTKRFNRKLEFSLRNTELFAAIAASEGLAEYPRADLLSCWKQVLTNQFHDIIPGSSIRRVYAEAEEAYQQVENRLSALQKDSRQKIASAAGGGFFIFNDLSWEREDPVSFPTEILQREAGAAGGKSGLALDSGSGPCPLQEYVDLDGRPVLTAGAKVPALGWARFQAVPSDPAPSPFTWNEKERLLLTPFYRARFDETGAISSLWDLRRDCELVGGGPAGGPAGRFNRLISAEDVPVFWEAWDVDADWTLKAADEEKTLSLEVIAQGPVCFRLRRKCSLCEASLLIQDTVFYAAERRIDFETKVDWREKRRLLKAAFDTALDAAQVRCEVQYGHLLRNTHKNLPQDRAKFEICAHKWICLEEAGGGIALLNDCKYGHDAEGGRIRISLLRSPIAPDEEADQGEHRFTYSILPFAGSFAESRVIRSAYELNSPAIPEAAPPSLAVKTPLPAAASLCAVENPASIVESVKEAEDGSGDLIIRLYESLGGRTRSALRFSREIASAALVDMLEDAPANIAVSGKGITLEFRAFEIKTLRVRLRPL